MPQNLTYPRSEREAHIVQAELVFERHRFAEWARANPKRMARVAVLRDFLLAIGVFLSFAAWGLLLGWRG